MTASRAAPRGHGVQRSGRRRWIWARRGGRLAIIASILGPALAGAQDTTRNTVPGAGTVRGQVRSAGSGTALAGVAVLVEGTRLGALTDSVGAYEISGVPAGRRALIARRIGLGPARDTVAIAPDAVVLVDFRMRDTAAVLEPVVVSATGEAQRRGEASATIDVLSGEEIRRSRAAHPAELMNRLPGVHVTELSGEGHMTAIRQPITTKPVYLYLEDGVPTRATGFFNHNALYEVNVPQAGGIEVLKGPGTALYGSDAVGGVINVLTRPAPLTPALEATAEGGANGWARLLVTGGNTWGRDGLRADLNLTRTDGWRDASGYRREIGAVRWDHAAASGWSSRTVVTASDIHQNDAFTLSQSQFDDRSALNRSPIAYRHVQAARWSTALERDANGGRARWSVTPYARYDVLDLIPYWQLTYDPQRWDTRNASVGVLTRYRRDLAPLRARVIVGADADWSPGRFTAWQVAATMVGTGADRTWSNYTLGERQYDYDVTYRAVSPYAQLELSPFPRLRLDAGARVDVAGYAYDTRLAPDESPASVHRRPADTTVRYHHLSPKVGLTVDLGGGASLFASYRHGFRAPSQGQLFQQNSADNTVGLRPVQVDAYETGVRGEWSRRVLYQLSLYHMTLSDDILTFVTERNTRVAVNAARSRHRGIEGALGVNVAPAVRLDASWSVSDQRYLAFVPQAARPATDSSPARPGVDYSGNRVEQAPREMGNVTLTWSPPFLRGGRFGFSYDHTGRYAADAANTHWYDGHDVFGVQANVFVRPDVELFARATNLLDRQYAELASFDPFQGMQYNPGSPRTIYAGVHYLWGR